MSMKLGLLRNKCYHYLCILQNIPTIINLLLDNCRAPWIYKVWQVRQKQSGFWPFMTLTTGLLFKLEKVSGLRETQAKAQKCSLKLHLIKKNAWMMIILNSTSKIFTVSKPWNNKFWKLLYNIFFKWNNWLTHVNVIILYNKVFNLHFCFHVSYFCLERIRYYSNENVEYAIFGDQNIFKGALGFIFWISN